MFLNMFLLKFLLNILLKTVIFIVFVLQACNEVLCRECSDCQEYTSCKPAVDLILSKRDDDTRDKFSRAYCGYDYDVDSFKVCCSDFKVNDIISTTTAQKDTSDKVQLLPEICGDIDGSRIVGGRVAKMYEFPWMALISVNRSSVLSFECGGSIINSRYILTAAHCVAANQPNCTIAGVRLGEHDIHTVQDCQELQGQYVCESHIQDVAVEKIIVHDNFQRGQTKNNIALLRLAEDIDFSFSNVAPVCLPIYPNLRYKTLTGERGTITGWGITETGKLSPILLKVAIPIKTAEACQGVDPSGQFCAGDINKDSCFGDLGGPLVLEEDYNNVDRFIQFGIASHGPRRCGSSPSVYTDVRKYLDWILEKIEP